MTVKKIIIFLFIIILLEITQYNIQETFASEIGINYFYTSWYIGDVYVNVHSDYGFLGPSFTYDRINRWTISTNFFSGHFQKTEQENENMIINYFNADRYEFNIYANRLMNKYFNILFNINYTNFLYYDNDKREAEVNYYIVKRKYLTQFAGLGIGFLFHYLPNPESIGFFFDYLHILANEFNNSKVEYYRNGTSISESGKKDSQFSEIKKINIGFFYNFENIIENLPLKIQLFYHYQFYSSSNRESLGGVAASAEFSGPALYISWIFKQK